MCIFDVLEIFKKQFLLNPAANKAEVTTSGDRKCC